VPSLASTIKNLKADASKLTPPTLGPQEVEEADTLEVEEAVATVVAAEVVDMVEAAVATVVELTAAAVVILNNLEAATAATRVEVEEATERILQSQLKLDLYRFIPFLVHPFSNPPQTAKTY